MKKIAYILVFCCFCRCVVAQPFQLPKPKGKAANGFTKQFVKLLNQAPYDFSKYKGKKINGQDALHLQSAIHKSKIQLKGFSKGRYVADSTCYMEFFGGDYPDFETAQKSLMDMHDQVALAMGNNALMYYAPVDSVGKLAQQIKVAYTKPNGFFHFNTALQILRLNNNQYRTVLQVYHGRPIFYRKIFAAGITSPLFTKEVHKNIDVLHKNRLRTCPIDIPGFECVDKTFTKDSVLTIYTLNDEEMECELSAFLKFDIALSNIQAALGTHYVYYDMPVKQPYIKRYVFIKAADVEKHKRLSVVLDLIKSEGAYTRYEYDDNHTIKLMFVTPKGYK